MKKIRENLFETNSSSTHSLSFKFKKSQLPDDKLDISGDTCIIQGIDQQDYYPLVWGERLKLDYIFTWMYIRDDGKLAYTRWDDEGDDDPDTSDLWWNPLDINETTLETGSNEGEYCNVLEAIKRKYPEVRKICFKNAYNSSFDHQTSPYEEGPIVDLTNLDEIYNYLFNNHITVEIGHD